MFKFSKTNSLVKKVLVSGATLLMLAGVGAGASNVNIHASGFNLAKIEQSARAYNPQKATQTGKYAPNDAKTRQEKQATADFRKGMVLNNNAKPAKNPNSNCKVSYKNFNHKSRRHVVRKARKRVRRHVARKEHKARKNTRGYKNYEVKNLAVTLNRLDKKVVRSHGRKRAKLIKNMRHVNGRLIRLAGNRRGNKSTRGYKNYESKNIAKTLNRLDKKANRSHGKKYAKLIKNLKHCNYTLIQLAK